MGSTVKNLSKAFRRKSRFEAGIACSLPEAYKKFWIEWKCMQPAAVHYIPQKGKWKRNPVTGEVLPIQNVPLPLKHPKEIHLGIWGGEAIIKGFVKNKPTKRRVPRFWVPILQRTVVRSEVLNTHLSVIVTHRTIQLIHDHYGFDHYLLKTPACDLVSVLALKLKQKILKELLDGCPSYANDPEKQQAICNEYKDYLSSYTPEEIEWYGLTWPEAIYKIIKIKQAENITVPKKVVYRQNLIEKLKAAGIKEAGATGLDSKVGSSSWLSKINPFGKKNEA